MSKEDKKCTWCGGKATRQTVNGEYNERLGGFPINDGWFCDKCWDEGDQIEKDEINE